MAYVGTSSNIALKQLLHVAVSDVNDDVRRQSVIALGFILCRNPKHVPRVVQLLSESYNPHVRYGACMALGIACAGTGNKEAMELLEPLTKDTTDFVRQAALIAAAMILVEQQVDNKQTEEEVKQQSRKEWKESKEAEKEKKLPSNTNKPTYYRKLFSQVYGQKHEDPMAKFGSVLAAGIIEAGGRNVNLTMLNSQGTVQMDAAAGLLLFSQFWWWYPLAHFLCLAFRPTFVVALNKDLKMPVLEFKSNAKPSTFAYPLPTKPIVAEKIEKVAAAVLSTTAKAKARKQKKDNMDIVSPVEEENKEEEPVSVVPEKEEDFQMLPNLSRVVSAQVKVVSFPDKSRYELLKNECVGILLAKDLKPGEKEEIVEFSVKEVKPAEDGDKEPSPPEPFEYNE
jgi:26S proteasome regulatory subunit N2